MKQPRLTTLSSGEWLTVLRKLNGLTRQQLADKPGLGIRQVILLMSNQQKWKVSANKIKQFPIFQKYTAGELARIVDLPADSLSGVIDGKNFEVDSKTLEKLALVLYRGNVNLILEA